MMRHAITFLQVMAARKSDTTANPKMTIDESKQMPAKIWSAITTFAVASIAIADTAFAYIGPGAGLSAIGTLLAILAAVGLALVGFVWYPLKRLFGKKSQTDADMSDETKSEA